MHKNLQSHGVWKRMIDELYHIKLTYLHSSSIPCSPRKQEANHSPSGHTRARCPITHSNSRLLHVVRIVRKPGFRGWISQSAPSQTDSHSLRTRARVDNNDRNTAILILERRALQIAPTTRAHSHRIRPYNAELGKRPQPFRHLIRLAINKNEFLVVIVVCGPILHAFPENVGAEVGVDDAIKHRVRPGKSIACTATRVPCCAPSSIQIRVLRLPHPGFRFHWTANSRRILVACNRVDHAFHTTRNHLASVLVSNAPSRGFAAVYANVRHVILVERGTQHFYKFCGLVPIAVHASVGGCVVGFVEEADVRYFDSSFGVQLDVFHKVVCVRLFPVAGAAIGS